MSKRLRLSLILFVPYVAFGFYLAFFRPDVSRLPGWVRWSMLTYFVLALVAPVIFVRMKVSQVASENIAVDCDRTRRTLKRMLYSLIFTFVSGSIIATFQHVVPWTYAILPLGINLAFILLLCRAIFGSVERVDKK